MTENKGKAQWDHVREMLPESSLKVGPYFTHHLKVDPRRLSFTFSRYKFVSKMLGESPKKSVLEIGCSEGMGTLLLAQVASRVVGTDFDEKAIAVAKQLETENLKFVSSDFYKEDLGKFDCVVSLDVIEHVPQNEEMMFLERKISHLNPFGMVIIGTPNITANEYASEESKRGHINLYSHERLKKLLLTKFHNVFMFGMNDEVLHTGFAPMCHYLFGIGCNLK